MQAHSLFAALRLAKGHNNSIQQDESKLDFREQGNLDLLQILR